MHDIPFYPKISLASLLTRGARAVWADLLRRSPFWSCCRPQSRPKATTHSYPTATGDTPSATGPDDSDDKVRLGSSLSRTYLDSDTHITHKVTIPPLHEDVAVSQQRQYGQ